MTLEDFDFLNEKYLISVFKMHCKSLKQGVPISFSEGNGIEYIRTVEELITKFPEIDLKLKEKIIFDIKL